MYNFFLQEKRIYLSENYKIYSIGEVKTGLETGKIKYVKLKKALINFISDNILSYTIKGFYDFSLLYDVLEIITLDCEILKILKSSPEKRLDYYFSKEIINIIDNDDGYLYYKLIKKDLRFLKEVFPEYKLYKINLIKYTYNVLEYFKSEKIDYSMITGKRKNSKILYIILKTIKFISNKNKNKKLIQEIKLKDFKIPNYSLFFQYKYLKKLNLFDLETPLNKTECLKFEKENNIYTRDRFKEMSLIYTDEENIVSYKSNTNYFNFFYEKSLMISENKIKVLEKSINEKIGLNNIKILKLNNVDKKENPFKGKKIKDLIQISEVLDYYKPILLTNSEIEDIIYEEILNVSF